MQTETQFRNLFKFNINQLEFACHPAIVVGIDKIKQGLIDAQPLTTRPTVKNDPLPYPTIQNVPVISYCTQVSRITLPVNVGDTVLLLFTKHSNDNFVAGNIEVHEPSDFSIATLNNAVALLGFNSVLDSPFDNVNYNSNLDFNNLNIVHNADTPNEVVLSLTTDGKIKTNAPIYTESDVYIKNLSVLQHMFSHQHPYTDDGKPMVTSPPIPQSPQG